MKIEKIDMHMHSRLEHGIMRITGGGYTTPQELRRIYDDLNIDKGVQLPISSPECRYYIMTNEEAYELSRRHPDLYYWFCNVDPRWGGNSPDSDLSYYIEYYKKLGAKGVGEVVANMHFKDPLMQNLFYHCEKTGMPLTMHIAHKTGGTYGIVDDLGLGGLEYSLEKYPNLIFIGHSQCFWSHIGDDVNDKNWFRYPSGPVKEGKLIKMMRRFKNLHADLSATSGYNAVSRDPDFGVSFLEEFQDRLYFGTDISSADIEMVLSFWLDEMLDKNKISYEAYYKICRGNALKILENQT